MEKKLWDILERENERIKNSEKIIKKPNGDKAIYKPFYNSLLAANTERTTVYISDGEIIDIQEHRKKYPHKVLVEIRMGDAEKGGGVYFNLADLPSSLNLEVSNKILDKEADVCFWESCKNYEDRFRNTLGKKNLGKIKDFAYFSKNKPVQYFKDSLNIDFDLESYTEKLRLLSKELNDGWMHGNVFQLNLTKSKSNLINSEGTKISDGVFIYDLNIIPLAEDDRGLIIPQHYKLRRRDSYLTIPQVRKFAYQAKSELEKTLKSPLENNGIYPSILDGENTGVLFHEVVGHGLEGHRLQLSDWEETSLFKNKHGKKIAPDFINLWDDPSIEKFNNIKINGFYKYDNDGVEGKKVHLIKNGNLNDYLHSRQSAGYLGVESNGHCRSDKNNEPVSRMSNILVKSNNPLKYENLIKKLQSEIEKQNAPYGLIFKNSTGGWVMTEESFYQTAPLNVFRLYKNGKMERVRGIEIVGTPYQTLQNIKHMGDDYGVFNGFCGAESGLIPASEIAPSSLVSSLEVKMIPEHRYTDSLISLDT